MKFVTVIVPAFRDKDDLDRCLDALSRQSYPADRTEIIIIDNTPDFEFRDLAGAFAPAKLLHEPKPGSYSARNRGLQDATGEVLAFTDADCLPYPDWVERGVRALEAYPEGALIAGRIEVFAQDPERPTAPELYELAFAFKQDRYVAEGFGATANVFVTPKVIDTAGPFMAQLASGGDKEFGKRVHSLGIPVVYSERATIRHPARRRLGELLKKAGRIVRGVYDLERARGVPTAKSFRGMVGDLRPPVRLLSQLMKNRDVGHLGHRIRAASILLVLHYYRAFYRLRLIVAGS